MNKEEAAGKLGISVRSLQRLVQSQKISVTYKRGESGKQEAIFNEDELENYKNERDIETVKPSSLTTGDTSLARNDATKFLEILKDVIVPQTKQITVSVAEKPLLKLDEASALTGLSRDTLKSAISSGTLKAKVIGRAYRIKRADLNIYIENL